MDILEYFNNAHAVKARPLLLEFAHPQKRTPLAICGIYPTTTLMVKNGRLFKDGVDAGPALALFEQLSLAKSQSFLPAYLGFFSYEFARHFEKPVKEDPYLFPDAFFCLYEQGLVIDDGHILHHDELPDISAVNSAKLFDTTLTPSMEKEVFYASALTIKERIKKGDVYQVNLSLPFFFSAQDEDMLPIYQTMRTHNKSPFMGIVHHDDFWLLSGSPERLFSLNGQKLTTRPIAGTKKRGTTPALDEAHIKDLKTCVKENAEHAMLVDLMRNDLNQIAHNNSVAIDEDRTVEFYSHVMHLVSSLSCDTKAPLLEIFKAVFPGGTITGAPKISVMQTIAHLESCPRGPYTGALGYVSSGYGVDFNILIRSVFKAGDKAFINTGAGIVIDSLESSEWQEVHRKAMAIKDILLNRSEAKPTRASIIGPHIILKPNMLPAKNVVIRFMENNDSFSYNIIAALNSLGAQVLVDDKGIFTGSETHVVIGPGPGNPADLPHLMQVIAHAIKHNLPLLGICLGHQAIGAYFGAGITRLHEPIHGKSAPLFHQGERLFKGVAPDAHFARYHSLAIEQTPKDFITDAVSADNAIMAISHKHLPIFGLQFHPESYLSNDGHLLLWNFLAGGYE